MAHGHGRKLQYRTLAPKGRKSLPRSTLPKPKLNHGTDAHRGSKRCRVPVCQRIDCQLQSHLDFKSEPARPEVDQHTGESDAVTNCRIDTAGTDPGRAGVMLLFYDGLHRFPDLPVENAAYVSFRQLCHDFFLNYYDRLELITTPPPVSTKQKARMAAWAESNEVVFLNTVALTHNLRMAVAGEKHDDLSSHYFHAKVTGLLIRKLHKSEGFNLENVTLIVCTLISLEIMNGNLSRLPVHRNGLDELINRQGGIHNLTFSLRNTLHMDRVISVYTCTPPRYAPPPDNSIRRPRRCLQTHGFYFSCLDDQDSIQPMVVEHCLDLCEVLEEFDAQQVTYDPRTAVASIALDLTYFYFIRDRVAINFCYLHATYSKENTISRCILLASKILEYPILYSNWIRDLPMFLATELQGLLLEQDLDDEWFGHENTLIWVLFVLLTMPSAWSGHLWALNLLHDRLNVKHGGSAWPTNWRALERAALSNFVWHLATLDQSFREVCASLVRESMVEERIRF